MLSHVPGDGVTERAQLLVHRAVGIAAPVRDAGKRSDGESHLTGRINKTWSDDGAVGRNLLGSKAYARQELTCCNVGSAVEKLVVHPTPQLVNQTVENSRV